MVRAGETGAEYSRENILIIRVLRGPETISIENKSGGRVDEQKGLCPLSASGAGPAEPRQPAPLTPAAPRPRRSRPGRREGGRKGQGEKSAAGAAGRDEEKGRFVSQKCRGNRMGSPAPLNRCCGGQAGEQPAWESHRPPRGWMGAEPGDPGYPQPLPRASHAAAASRRRGRRRSSSPAPDAHAVCNKKSVSGSSAGAGR